MVLIAEGARAQEILRYVRRRGHPAWAIGEVVKGKQVVKIE